MRFIPSATQLVRELKREQAKKPNYPQNPEKRLGTVSATYGRTDPKLPVTFDGEDVEVFLNTTVEAMPGDRVTIERWGNAWIVTGVIRDFDWFYASNLGFGTGWTNYGGGWESVKARRDPAGVVHLEGMLRSTIGPNANVMFTLPEGYRPSFNRIQVVASNVVRRLFIGSNGAVNLYVDTGVVANDFVSLSGVSFLAGP